MLLRPLAAALALALVLTIHARADELDSAGCKLHYTVEGKATGEPVVLIHGLGASADTNWRLPGVIARLSSSARVIAIDCRGHGKSGKPDGDDAYGEAMVEDVVRLLDHLKLESAHLVGYSMGGMISLKLAVKHPERCRSVFLGGMGWMRDGSPLARFWELLPARDGGRAPSGLIRGFSKFAVTEKELKAIKVPVQVVVGDLDPVRRLYVEPLRRARPDWRVVTVRGAGHLTCVLRHELKDELVAWLEARAAH